MKNSIFYIPELIQPVKYILETAFPVLKFHKLTAYKAFSIIKIEDEGTAS